MYRWLCVGFHSTSLKITGAFPGIFIPCSPTERNLHIKLFSMAAANIREVNRVTKCQIDGGDRELALKILNLHHRPGQPMPIMLPQAAFLAVVNAQLAMISPTNFTIHAAHNRAVNAVRRVVSALKTVDGIQSWIPGWNLTQLIVINVNDIPLGTNVRIAGEQSRPLSEFFLEF
jgi:hypothetical protein